MSGSNKAAVILIILLIMFAAVTAAAQEGPRVITAITLEGNNEIDDSEILALIKTKVGDLLDEEQLREDMQAVFDTGYFQDISISFVVHRGGLNAIFELQEYPVISEIIIDGNKKLSNRVIKEQLNLNLGEILNHNKLNEGHRNVVQFYHDEGYLLAGLEDINFSEEGILTLTINEGYINDVIIKGNTKTKEFVITREVEFNPGEVLNVNILQESFQNLYRLEFFEEINPYLEAAGDNPFKRNIVIEVKEGKTGNAGTGVSWSSAKGWLGYFDVRERNLMGNGQTLSFNWEFGSENNYILNFYEPWLFNTPTSMGLSLYDRRTTFTSTDKGEYEEHRRGGSISLGHNLINEWDGRITYKTENTTKDWEKDEYPFEDRLLRSLTFQVGRNTTNHPRNPSSGAVDTFSVEYAGQIIGGDSDFTKYRADLRRYFPGFRDDHAWALRLNAGTATGDLDEEFDYFKLGGANTLRGYEIGEFSGKDMMMLKLEYRFPVVDSLSGVVFADAGQAWKPDEDIVLTDMHYSLGAGARLDTPLGQLRLDYGFNEEGRGKAHFGLGQAF